MKIRGSERVLLVAASLAAAGAVSYLGWSWLGAGPGSTATGGATGAAKGPAQSPADVGWDRAVFHALDPAGERSLGSEIESLVEGKAGGADGTQRKLLAETLARQLSARAADTPDAYLALAQSDPTTGWIQPNDERAWHFIDTYFEFHEHERPDRADVRGVLRRFLDRQWTQDRGRLVAVATDPGEARIVTYRVRAREQIELKLAELLPGEEFKRWFGAPGHSAIRFRKAQRPFDEVLTRDGSALVAVACLLVRTEGGTIYNWNTIWYFDPGSARWVCESMARKGWNGVMYF